MPALTTTVDDSSPVFQWLPPSSWGPASSSSDSAISSYFQSTAMATNTVNANVTFTFVGHNIQIYGGKRANHGMYQVQLDDKVYDPMNGFMGSPEAFQQVLFSADGLNDIEHVVTLKNLEDAKYLDLDYVTWQSDIGSDDQLIVETIQDTNPALEYEGKWDTNPRNLGTFFGGSGHVSTEPGSSIKYSFTGGAVALYGPADPQGASFSTQLDNEVPQNFSFHNSHYVPHSILYFRGGLQTGKRTLKVTATDGNMLAIDYINVFTTSSIGSVTNGRLPPTTIAAIIIGTLSFLALFLISIYYCTRQEKIWDKSDPRFGRFLELGWWKSKFNRKDIVGGVNRVRKRKKNEGLEKFDLDGGGQYTAVGGSERESEYLLPNYGPVGAIEPPRLEGTLAGIKNDEMGRLSVQFDAFSESSRTASHSTGGTGHSKRPSSLSGLSALNQPVTGAKSSTDVAMISAPGSSVRSGDGVLPRRNQLSPPPGSSGILGTPTPSTVTIPSVPSQPRASSVSPPPGNVSSRPRLAVVNMPSFPKEPRPQKILSWQPQAAFEPGPSSPRVQQDNFPELERKRTVVLPLPPGAAKPVARDTLETDEFGGMSSPNKTSIGSGLGRAGNRNSVVVGPRVRSSTGQRMSFSASAQPDHWTGPGASGGGGSLVSEKSRR